MSDSEEEQELLVCPRCNSEVPETEAVRVEDYYRPVCSDCTESCVVCDRNFTYLDEHQFSCDECGENCCERYTNQYSCYECGGSYCEDCINYDEDDDEYYCRHHYHRRDGRIHSYDYDPPSWKPKGNWPHEVLMGFELEVGIDQTVIADSVDLFNVGDHLYLKHDGSIRGAEIVSHPMTLEWARSFPFPKLLTQLWDAGCITQDVNMEYGFHIHVSRNAFRRDEGAFYKGGRSASHTMTWLMFMHRNDAALEALGRRNSGEWATFGNPGQSPPRGCGNRSCNECRDYRVGRSYLSIAANGGRGDGARYRAVNCCNSRTFEMRFPESTLDIGEFMGMLEFTDASVNYTRNLTSGDIRNGALNFRKFAEWVAERDYPHLLKQIEARVLSLEQTVLL